MLKLYTDMDNLPHQILADPHIYFNYFFNWKTMLTDEVIRCIETIEGSKHLFDDIFDGKFGKYTIKDMSTGCKTVLAIMLFSDEMIGRTPSLLHCGSNALTYILNNIDTEIPLYWDTDVFPKDNLIENLEVLCNDKIILRTYEEFIHISMTTIDS